MKDVKRKKRRRIYLKIVTTNEIAGKEIVEHLGYVKGSVVRAKHIGKDILSGLKNIVGGEMTAYSEMLEEARKIAVHRMVTDAEELGADAIVGLKFSSSMITQGAAEILAFGTAVKLKSK